MQLNKLSDKEAAVLNTFLAKFNGNELLLQREIADKFIDEIAAGLGQKEIAKKAFTHLLPNDKPTHTGYCIHSLVKVFDNDFIRKHFEQVNPNLVLLKKFENFTEFKKSVCDDLEAAKWAELGKSEKTTQTYSDPRYYFISKVVEKLLNANSKGNGGKKAKRSTAELIAELAVRVEKSLANGEVGYQQVLQELDRLRTNITLRFSSVKD